MHTYIHTYIHTHAYIGVDCYSVLTMAYLHTYIHTYMHTHAYIGEDCHHSVLTMVAFRPEIHPQDRASRCHQVRFDVCMYVCMYTYVRCVCM